MHRFVHPRDCDAVGNFYDHIYLEYVRYGFGVIAFLFDGAAWPLYFVRFLAFMALSDDDNDTSWTAFLSVSAYAVGLVLVPVFFLFQLRVLAGVSLILIGQFAVFAFTMDPPAKPTA